MKQRFDSTPPTSPASPLVRHPRSGLYPVSATTLTSVEGDVIPGSWIPYGAPTVIVSLRCALKRINGAPASWSCYRAATGLQIAVAHVGPLRVTAEADTSDLAILRLRDLVLGLEAQRKAFTNA